jgi:hypothetical protein
MALTKCRECGAQVSTESLTCPHCGVPRPSFLAEPTPRLPLQPSDTQHQAPSPPPSRSSSHLVPSASTKPWLIGGIAVLAVAAIILVLIGLVPSSSPPGFQEAPPAESDHPPIAPLPGPETPRASAPDQAYFLGSWRLIQGELHPVTRQVVRSFLHVSQAGSEYSAKWTTELDGFAEHLIPLTYADGRLVGDYYGAKNNVVIKQGRGATLSFSIDPFAEFQPISNAIYQRTSPTPQDQVDSSRPVTSQPAAAAILGAWLFESTIMTFGTDGSLVLQDTERPPPECTMCAPIPEPTTGKWELSGNRLALTYLTTHGMTYTGRQDTLRLEKVTRDSLVLSGHSGFVPPFQDPRGIRVKQ